MSAPIPVKYELYVTYAPVDQGGQDRDPLDAPLLSSLQSQRGAVAPRRHRLQPRQSPAAARLAARHPELVTDELATAAVQDWWALIRHALYFVLLLAERGLTSRLFGQIVWRIERLAGHPT